LPSLPRLPEGVSALPSSSNSSLVQHHRSSCLPVHTGHIQRLPPPLTPPFLRGSGESWTPVSTSGMRPTDPRAGHRKHRPLCLVDVALGELRLQGRRESWSNLSKPKHPSCRMPQPLGCPPTATACPDVVNSQSPAASQLRRCPWMDSATRGTAPQCLALSSLGLLSPCRAPPAQPRPFSPAILGSAALAAAASPHQKGLRAGV
jgi:hypothetical protein